MNVNEVNDRDCMVGEIFEFLDLRIKMVINYVKLLDNIFSKYVNYFFEQKVTNDDINIFKEYKKKITKLIFLKILNLNNDNIIKQCTIFLCDIFDKDKNLRDEIYKEFNGKINELIDKINIEEIRKSKCLINYEIINGLQLENINSLLIICKSMKLKNDHGIKNKLIETFRKYIR